MTAEQWQAAYENVAQHSWDQTKAALDLELLDEAQLSPAASVVDIGGGDGAFIESMLARGQRDLTVLDIAESALAAGRRRLGDRRGEIDWISADVRAWSPARTWQVWHDRAVFHFLTNDGDRADYRRALAEATTPRSLVCVGTFADDGPTYCSGFRVARYTSEELADQLRGGTLDLDLLAAGREVHRTPGDLMQPFSWVLLRRMS